MAYDDFTAKTVSRVHELENALAEKEKEIAELKKRVQRPPEEWESVCGECNGSGWR